uniref:MAM domain-containing protein n=1 Tax=Ciona savignyi TaxID=51511 RepID=H2Z7Q7_CIOSA
MNIEIGPPDCAFDGVEIYDYKANGSKYDLPLDYQDSLGMTKYCGKVPFPAVISATSKVDVIFYSDEQDEENGFLMTWNAVPIPEDQFNCTFEASLCTGWSNLDSGYDELDWAINQGKTSTAGTGPDFDHTLNNENGSYVYIEASAPARPNYRAMLSTPTVQFTDKVAAMCVRYWYHMLGRHVGTFAVAIESNGTSTIMTSYDGSQSDKWMMGELEVPKQDLPFRIIFTGIRGTGFVGDIALDDVTIVEEPCNYVAETTTEEITTTETIMTTTSQPETTTTGLIEPPMPGVIECLSNEYKCASGFSCISNEFICDGVPDCLDSDDEENCDGFDLTGLPPILTNASSTTQAVVTTTVVDIVPSIVTTTIADLTTSSIAETMASSTTTQMMTTTTQPIEPSTTETVMLPTTQSTKLSTEQETITSSSVPKMTSSTTKPMTQS